METVKTILLSLWALVSVIYIIHALLKPKVYMARMRARTESTSTFDTFFEIFTVGFGLVICFDLIRRVLVE